MKNAISIFSIFLFSIITYAQNSPLSEIVYLKKIKTVNPLSVKEDFAPRVSNLEMPNPSSEKYKLQKIKKESQKRFSRTGGEQSWVGDNYINPKVLEGYAVTNKTIVPPDTFVSYISGGRPNDNTLAISNDGLLISAFNSSIFAYNTIADTSLFKVLSLHAFSSEFTLNDKYDPKLLYDPIDDRFILVFLNGRLSTENQIIVAFSTTNNPTDDWNLYAVPGNPLNDTTWFDYPAIAISENELFLTGNQLIDNEPWQTGFAQSVIWQIKKKDGYNGNNDISTRLWSGINDNGLYIRNLNPIQGGSNPSGPNTYFLSNKNFTVLCDSIYLLEITGELDNPTTELKITLGHTNTHYGAPPNARQSHVDSLATNDARILGGFIENDEIQYVANTVYPNSGYAGIYHGFISNLNSTPIFSGKILADDSLDLGYPNIAYTGTHDCSRQSLIMVNHTSPYHGAGYSTIQHNSNGNYSELITLKQGEGYVDRLTGYERWGDYSGIQRKYNENGIVWGAGFYARNNNINYTWISQVQTKNEIERLSIEIIDSSYISSYGANDGSFEIEAIGGLEPYNYFYSDNSLSSLTLHTNLKPEKYLISVTDNNNCSAIDSITIVEPMPESNVFPNPVIHDVNVYFELESNTEINVELYDLKGNLIKHLYFDKAKAGSNLFTFSTLPLRVGTYILKVKSPLKTVVEEKIVKY